MRSKASWAGLVCHTHRVTATHRVAKFQEIIVVLQLCRWKFSYKDTL